MSGNHNSNSDLYDNTEQSVDPPLQEDSPEDEIDGDVSGLNASSRLAHGGFLSGRPSVPAVGISPQSSENYNFYNSAHAIATVPDTQHTPLLNQQASSTVNRQGCLPVPEEGAIREIERGPARARAPITVNPPSFPGFEVHTSLHSDSATPLDLRHAVSPGYASLRVRLASFDESMMRGMPSPSLLATAGFYHTDNRDVVRCFYCGAGLGDWDEHDDPWVNHIRFRFSCEYVRQQMGEQFAYDAFGSTHNEEQ